MKTGLYFLCCVGFAIVLVVEVSSQQSLLDEPVDKRGLYLESAQSQNAAAAAGKQSSSFLNVDGGYPSQNYFGSAQQVQPQYSAPGSWSGADGNSLHLGQQSSESASSHASSNQYSKLIADGAYGGQAVNQYPQYLPSGLSSLQGQLSQSGVAASAPAPSSGSQYSIGNGDQLGNSYYPTSGNSQYLSQNSQPEVAGSAQGSPSNLFEQQLNYQPQSHPQSQFLQYPQEYYGPSGYPRGASGVVSSSASAGASAGGSGATALAGSSAGPSGISEAAASAVASSQSFQPQETQPQVVPRLKCGYVRQCKPVFEPASPY